MVTKLESMKILYQSFDPIPYNFPTPRVPFLPKASLAQLQIHSEPLICALFNAPNAVHYARARYALTDAYRMCGVGPKGALLAPAYHCRTMFDPAIRLGARVDFYRSDRVLKPDLDHLRETIRDHDGQIAAILASHFFGLEQDLGPLLEMCSTHGIALIEDCSHCLFLPKPGSSLGRQGRYCVSSPYKFFPVEDGGVLWANYDAPLPNRWPVPFNALRELKAIARTTRDLLHHDHAKDLRSPIEECCPQEGAEQSTDLVHESDTWSSLYETNAETLSSLATSRWQMRHLSASFIAKRRRQNYLAWTAWVSDLPNCEPIAPELTADCVPYMFPLRIDAPRQLFPFLKRSGIPVGRWDDIAVSDCQIATDYRTHLLHLPCHQSLSADQMNWMMQTVKCILQKLRH
jgi:perosamine synthetase